jgi:hypothetical protein
MSGLPGRLFETSFLRRSLDSISSGEVPEARLDFIDLETELDEAFGDFPTGLDEYLLLGRACFEHNEIINSSSIPIQTRTYRGIEWACPPGHFIQTSSYVSWTEPVASHLASFILMGSFLIEGMGA